MASYIYDNYTEYLYDTSMTLWYAGATFQPNDPALVDTSAAIYRRSWKASRHEHVMHPEDVASLVAAEEEQWEREQMLYGEIEF